MAEAVTPWPEARNGAAMAYDARATASILFGGVGAGGQLLNDTWAWNGTTWKHKAATSSPPSRSAATMAPDSDSLMLFGGKGAGAVALGDTWTWGGKPRNWTQQTPPVSPAPRTDAAMAPDGRGNVVLFGGEGARVLSRQTNLGDTWLWDGAAKTWTQQTPVVAPPALARAAMAYDKASGKVLLFGGVREVNGFLQRSDETWSWDPIGRSWAKESPTNSPSARDRHSMAYDGASRKVILFGGADSTNRDDTWAWNRLDNTWAQQDPAVRPSARSGAAMGYHAPTQRVILFGGFITSTGHIDDTWAWNGVAVNWKKRGPS